MSESVSSGSRAKCSWHLNISLSSMWTSSYTLWWTTSDWWRKTKLILNYFFQHTTQKGIYTVFSVTVLPVDSPRSPGSSGMCRRSCHPLSQPTQSHSEPTEIMQIQTHASTHRIHAHVNLLIVLLLYLEQEFSLWESDSIQGHRLSLSVVWTSNRSWLCTFPERRCSTQQQQRQTSQLKLK